RAGAGPAPPRTTAGAARRRAQPDVAAAGLRVSPPLPVRAGDLPDRDAAARGGIPTPRGGVPPVPGRAGLNAVCAGLPHARVRGCVPRRQRRPLRSRPHYDRNLLDIDTSRHYGRGVGSAMRQLPGSVMPRGRRALARAWAPSAAWSTPVARDGRRDTL